MLSNRDRAWRPAGRLAVREYILPSPVVVARALVSGKIPWLAHTWTTSLEIVGALGREWRGAPSASPSPGRRARDGSPVCPVHPPRPRSAGTRASADFGRRSLAIYEVLAAQSA